MSRLLLPVQDGNCDDEHAALVGCPGLGSGSLHKKCDNNGNGTITCSHIL